MEPTSACTITIPVAEAIQLVREKKKKKLIPQVCLRLLHLDIWDWSASCADPKGEVWFEGAVTMLLRRKNKEIKMFLESLQLYWKGITRVIQMLF